MSSFLFGKLSQQTATYTPPTPDSVPVDRWLLRAAAAAAGSDQSDQPLAQDLDKTAAQPTETRPMSPALIESLLAIVPLEAIAAWTFITSKLATTTVTAAPKATSSQDLVTTITITDANAIKIAAAGCVLLAIVAYISGKVSAGGRYHLSKWKEATKGWQEWMRLLVPPIAFILWAYVQTPSVLREAMGRKPAPDAYWVIAVILGAVLMVGALALGVASAPQTTSATSSNPATAGGGQTS